jgi:hypothetical protein
MAAIATPKEYVMKLAAFLVSRVVEYFTSLSADPCGLLFIGCGGGRQGVPAANLNAHPPD